MQNYSNYYLWNCIRKQIGLKPVYGATGLGKTHGIKECIKKILEHNPNQKFIYITNRHALIQEIYQDLTEKYDINTSYLKSNNETLKELFESNELLNILNRLIAKDFFKGNNPTHLGNDKEALKQYFDTKIKALKSYTEDLGIRSHNTLNNKYLFNEEIEKIYSSIVKVLKEQFFISKKNNLTDFQKKFLNDSDIWQIFPYLRFENDPKCKVLVGTIQKFCRGFFNGKRDLKLHDLKHPNQEENFIIFLDEFDFLENEILNILCKEPQLHNSIEFVRFF